MSPNNRYIDCAIRMQVCKPSDTGPAPVKTHRVLGGVWDSWHGRYDPDMSPSEVHLRQVTQAQYDYCTSEMARITGAGGRGGGKSEALAQRCEYLILTRPGNHGLVVSPDYSHTQIIWEKLLRRVHQWTLPGTMGINRTRRLLRFVNGVTVRFLSADNPDSLRGWDAHWLGVDEEKDVSDEAIEIAMLCLRLAKQPLIFGAGTPEVGEYYERFERMKESKDCEVFRFPSRENCFIPHAVFDLAIGLMDERRYRQEVLAEFVRMDEDALVAKGFDRNIHKIDILKSGLKDVTRAYTKRKLRKSFSFIIGIDYNHSTPCVAWVYRVFEPNIWVVVDIVKAPDPAWKLAKDLKNAGYSPLECLVIDDASAEWHDSTGGSKSPNSSRRYMREHGFLCINPDPKANKNPPVRARIDGLTAKLSPAKGDPTWYYSARLGRRVYEVMENQVWMNTGWKLDKTAGYDHDMDAATYPIHRLEPPAKFTGSWGVRGSVAK